MTRSLYCVKLQKQAPGLQTQPYPGEIGEKIYQNISQEAWNQWLQRQIMFINEYRLNLADAKAREMLTSEMDKFLFGDSNDLPEGYVPPEK